MCPLFPVSFPLITSKKLGTVSYAIRYHPQNPRADFMTSTLFTVLSQDMKLNKLRSHSLQIKLTHVPFCMIHHADVYDLNSTELN